jgi:hypothetical protein
MRPVSTYVTIVALGVFLLFDRGFAQEPPPPEPAPAPPPRVEVIVLQHGSADELVSVVSKTLSNARQGTRIIADPRTNALIVSGSEAVVSEVRSLVTMLDVPAHGKPTPTRRSVNCEVVLFLLGRAAEEALKLPRTSTGVIDPSDPDAVLVKLREGIGKAGVTEIAKLSLMTDDGKQWKSRQAVQIPMTSEGRGAQTFAGYQEAVLDFGISSDPARDGVRRLGISCRIERFSESDKAGQGERESGPAAKQTNSLEFVTSAEDGKLVMAAVESSASRFDGSYVLFVRVKG